MSGAFPVASCTHASTFALYPAHAPKLGAPPG